MLRTLSNFLTAKRRVRTAALCAGFARARRGGRGSDLRAWTRLSPAAWIREGGNEHLTSGGDSSCAPMRSYGDAPSGVLQSASHRDPVPPSLPRVHTPNQRPKRPQSTERAARRGSVPPGKCLRAPSGVQPACLALTAEDQRQAARTRGCSFRSGLSKIKPVAPTLPCTCLGGGGGVLLKVLFAVTLCRIPLSPPGGSGSKKYLLLQISFFLPELQFRKSCSCSSIFNCTYIYSTASFIQTDIRHCSDTHTHTQDALFNFDV